MTRAISALGAAPISEARSRAQLLNVRLVFMPSPRAQFSGVAAGVPYIAAPPETEPGRSTPVVLAWHLLDAPRTESAFAAAVPLAGLDAWRIYFGLPMTGSRTPAGGVDEIMRLVNEDVVLNVHGPIAAQAAAEFKPAFEQLQRELDLGDGPVGLVGGSLGAGIAQLVLTEIAVPVTAVVLVSPVVQLRSVVEALARRFGVVYRWSELSAAVAARLDFVARAGEIARCGEPPLLLIVGADDDADAFLSPAQQLLDRLRARYADPERVQLHLVPGMAHPLAAEPGIDPAPQTPAAAEADRCAVAWLRQYLQPPRP
jgi:dienelactone hydrolase